MEGINRITDRIHEDVSREIEEIDARADADVAAVKARYAEQAQKERADILAQGRRAAEERVRRLEGAARLEAKKATLAAKQEMISRAFDTALEQLLALPEEAYVALLTKLAVAAVKTGREQVALSQKDRARYGVKMVIQANEQLGERGNLTLSETTRPIKGGLVLLRDRVEINGSFESLVRYQREAMEAQVAQVLFEGAL